MICCFRLCLGIVVNLWLLLGVACRCGVLL